MPRSCPALAGTGDNVRDLFGAMYDADPAELVRPAAYQILRMAKQHGVSTAVL